MILFIINYLHQFILRNRGQNFPQRKSSSVHNFFRYFLATHDVILQFDHLLFCMRKKFALVVIYQQNFFSIFFYSSLVCIIFFHHLFKFFSAQLHLLLFLFLSQLFIIFIKILIIFFAINILNFI
ncbi:transmembrane protein, putative (macronuclear) [Tetrahymena thermophila SB210]|uniref:Transmembrane protein, putative n=1 Tax=Tetrahymena thermophila (strain SB210) TaxID=312017 RepID=W7XGV9_TETTS|nr:transmembrane protein, putative [Tetrahymena thermophila SB210]EWS73496.1 transmembrane protein, putative [Tetrahymena thermophila SB210]|eukprot:XP_012653978.1 transmembrane protein, putative [Tetrahymena thermophila SB210]